MRFYPREEVGEEAIQNYLKLTKQSQKRKVEKIGEEIGKMMEEKLMIYRCPNCNREREYRKGSVMHICPACQIEMKKEGINK